MDAFPRLSSAGVEETLRGLEAAMGGKISQYYSRIDEHCAKWESSEPSVREGRTKKYKKIPEKRLDGSHIS